MPHESRSALHIALVAIPLEIRQQIWKNVLGGLAMHHRLERGRSRGWVCCSQDSSTCGSEKKTRSNRLNKGAISLLLTCSQISSEGFKYLYLSNPCITSGVDNTEYRLFILLPHRVNAIQVFVSPGHTSRR